MSRKKSHAGLLLILILVLSFTSYKETASTAQASTSEDSQWIGMANRAWRYFQAGAAVDPNTGLCGAGIGWPYFTDWDLATYILTIMDAEKLGIIPKTGTWGADDRINKIMAWLETRALTADNLPYLWYDSRTGSPALGSSPTNAADHGDLLVALHRLKEYRPDLVEAIDYIVKTRENTQELASRVANQKIYDYYIAHGFSFFGFDSYSAVANALGVLKDLMSGQKVDVYGIQLPQADITCEVLLLGMFNLDPDPLLAELTWNVYLAHERRYAGTGKFTAFSEGNTGLGYPSYIYEWVVTASGTMWDIEPVSVDPIAYFKVAIGFEALYNTSYARAMTNYLSSAFPDNPYGYQDGVDENGRLVDNIIDRTNGFVISAARYVTDVLSTPKLSDFPAPFIDASEDLEVTFIVGDAAPHGFYGWHAQTSDNLGATDVASKLGQLSASGDSEALLDSWIATYNETNRSVTELWEEAKNHNFISVGGPAVNMLTYDFERFNGVPFHLTWQNGTPCMHSTLTGENYTFEWGQWDYALISCVQYKSKNILLVWGLTAYGTLAACQLLQHFDTTYAGMLTGRAVIIKWTDLNGDGNVDLADELTVVEVWS
jgi:hypothetical protein